MAQGVLGPSAKARRSPPQDSGDALPGAHAHADVERASVDVASGGRKSLKCSREKQLLCSDVFPEGNSRKQQTNKRNNNRNNCTGAIELHQSHCNTCTAQYSTNTNKNMHCNNMSENTHDPRPLYDATAAETFVSELREEFLLECHTEATSRRKLFTD